MPDSVSAPDDHQDERAADAAASRQRGPVAGVLSWAMIVAGIAILVGFSWLGWRSYQAYTHLTNASADVSRLQDELRSVATADPSATTATMAHLQEESAAARSAVDDPVFRAATSLPWLGPNLAAVRQVTVSVDTLATEVLPSLVEVARSLRPAELAPRDGVVNLAPIQQAAGALQIADEAVNASREVIGSIDRSELVAPVGDAVLALENKLAAAASVTGTGARAARLLPPMFGANGPRDYLVVFQNLAEPRATGGIFGSFAAVHVDQGKVTVLDEGTPARTLGVFDPPVVQLSPEQIRLHTERPAVYPADVNFTPDFAVAADLFAKMYTARTGNAVDGVIAIDPVALSYLMAGTGPVDAGEGVVLTADNVVSVLLSTAYQDYADGFDQGLRDAFLARAAGAVFTAVTAGGGNAEQIMAGLVKASGERRLLVWSADPVEQADLAATELAGQLPQTPGTPTIGVFLNDGGADKLGYYLSNGVAVNAGNCRADGRRELQVKVTLGYAAPTSGLPTYVAGSPGPGEPYSIQTNVSVFAPVGGSLINAMVDGVATGFQPGKEGALDVATVTVVIAPGGVGEVEFYVLGPPPLGTEADVTPALALTPGVNPWVESADSFRPCMPGEN